MDIRFSEFYQPKPKQKDFHKSQAKYVLFGGAMGGGKSYALCAEALKVAHEYQGNRLVIVRRELSTARHTIIATFQKLCPKALILDFNKTMSTYTFRNGSTLRFAEADQRKDPLLDKIKGMEIGWFGIEEASEVSEAAFTMLKTRLRHTLPDSAPNWHSIDPGTGAKLPRYRGCLTSNPEDCWLKERFIDNPDKDHVYIQSLTTDNYSEDSEYFQTLKAAFKDSPELLKKYLEGDWSVSDAVNQLIPGDLLDTLRKEKGTEYGTAIGVDVARYGEDRTAICVIYRGKIKRIHNFKNKPVDYIVEEAKRIALQWNVAPEYIGIDGVGIGAGVVDYLRKEGWPVKDLIGGARPEPSWDASHFQPVNLRAQMYSALAQDLREGNLSLDKKDFSPKLEAALKNELRAIRFTISNDKAVKVLDKEALKKLSGLSPDLADSVAYANWIRRKAVGGAAFGSYIDYL